MVTVTMSNDKDRMTVGELLTVAQLKCEESKVASIEEAREEAEDPMVEVEKKKEEIASGKKPADEEVQAYFDDQAQFFKDLERAQKESLASLHDQQRRIEEAASGATSSASVTATVALE